MELEEAIEKSLDGEALLFVGAGFASGAINLRGEKFLSPDYSRKSPTDIPRPAVK